MVTLQDVIESRVVYAATGGLLPAACRAHSASRMIRGMATLGGEVVHGAPDSEVVAALLALNAVFVVRHSSGPIEIPRLRPALPQRPPAGLEYFTSGRVDLTVNGQPRHAEGEARTTLLDLLRREGFWGVKHGCETGECGACVVLLDGRPVNACLTLALRAHGHAVQTVEGMGSPDGLHPVQQAFVDTGAVQCGYCTPAMELCAKALLDAIPRPSEAEARDALAGCLCRCTGYAKPVQAVLQAARTAKTPAAASHETS
jgi:aerobic-type carbon monoxide dehydrogenase small subunit (CoxS/CutS family)